MESKQLGALTARILQELDGGSDARIEKALAAEGFTPEGFYREICARTSERWAYFMGLSQLLDIGSVEQPASFGGCWA